MVDADALTAQVKTELIDLAEAYTNTQAALTAYQAAATSAQTAADGFNMGSVSKADWYAALSAQADARAELCGQLAAFTSQANTLNQTTGGWVYTRSRVLNQTTGGWVSRTFSWYPDSLEPLFQSAAQQAAAAAAAAAAEDETSSAA